MTEDLKFYPFACPLPNSMVQSGTQVKIKGLASEKGKLLNGRTGTARGFSLSGGDLRWSVELCNDDVAVEDGEEKHSEEKRLVSVKIQNLEHVRKGSGSVYVFSMYLDSPSWLSVSNNGDHSLVAGMSEKGDTHDICLCTMESKQGGFDIERMKLDAPFMGLQDQDVEAVLNAVRMIEEKRKEDPNM